MIRLLPLVALLALWCLPAAAAVPPNLGGGGDPGEEQPADSDGVTFTDGTIAAEDGGPTDAEIADRLRAIYAALPGFEEIGVEVTQGVVTLQGTTVERTQIVQAAALAERLSGVVAVDNQLAADVSVDTRLQPAVNRAEELVQQSIALLPLLAVAVIIVVGFWILGALLSRQGWLWSRLAPNQLVANLYRMLIPLVFLVLGLVIALNILDAVAVLSAVLGAAGVLGLAVGFAVRDSIENFISSVMLSLRQPFRANDLVDIDGRLGRVVRLDSRATILLTPDGNHLRIPNAQVFKAVILNYTRNSERRITFDLGIDAADDPQAAMEAGLDRLHALEFVLKEPAAKAWVKNVGDSNIVLTFAPWIDQNVTDYLKAQSATIRATKDRLEADGFTLPEPIYRLKIDQFPGTLQAVRPEDAVETRSPTRPQETPAPEEADEDVDVTVDRTMERKVAEDRAASSEDDLLTDAAPTEFGDNGRN